MKGASAISPVKNKLITICPFKELSGYNVATIATKKQGKDGFGEEGALPFAKVKADDPIVAFRRPPPMPPLFSSLIALSLLEAWLRRDDKDK